MTEVATVGVVGGGLMGHGIAQVTAAAGYDVVLRETDEQRLAAGLGAIEAQLARAVDKGRASQQDAAATRARVQGTTDYTALAGCDLVLEAITESLPAKLELWRALDPVVKPEAIFATNTSSLAVVEQAAATSRPQRFVGIHYFNPAQVMKLVEVVRCVTTGDEAYAEALAFAEGLGKLAVQTQDKAGFIVNPVSPSTIWLAPPLILTAGQADTLVAALGPALDTAMRSAA